MIEQKLVDLIKAQKQTGKDDKDIITNLISSGWKVEDIEIVFKSLSGIENQDINSKPKRGKVFNSTILLVPILQIIFGYFIMVIGWACDGKSQHSYCNYLSFAGIAFFFASPFLILLFSNFKMNPRYDRDLYPLFNFFISLIIPFLVFILYISK